MEKKALNFDPVVLAGIASRLDMVCTALANEQTELLIEANKLKASWVTPSAAVFCNKRLVSVHDELGNLYRTLNSIKENVQDVAGIYETAEATAVDQAEELPTDIVL